MPRKPFWKKTNVPWKQKIAIWERMAQGYNDTQIWTWLQTKPKKYVHRDTIRLVRQELQDLPPELANELPEKVKVFWRQMRQEAGLPTTTSSIPSSRVEEGADAEAKCRLHQQDLRTLINKWIDQLKWPELEDLPKNLGMPERYCQGDFCWEVFEDTIFSGYVSLPEVHRAQIYCGVEDDPLFQSLKEHLEEDAVWAIYDNFKKEGGQYWYAGNVMKDRRDEMSTPWQSAQEVNGSYDDWKATFEEITASLTKLKKQIISRLRHILDLERIPGSCSRCREAK